MNPGLVVLLAAVLLALVLGGYRLATNGRFSARGDDDSSVLAGTPWADQLGERATLLQFSTAFCAPCRATRRVLGEVAEKTPGVVHLEVDAEQHLDVVRRLNVVRTPTTLVLDARGAEAARAGGAPTAQQVYAALGQAIGD